MSDGGWRGGYTGDIEVAACRSDQVTLVFIEYEGDYPSPQTVPLGAGETIFIIVEGAYSSGTFGVMVQPAA
jgi:hypothetical protein